MKIRNAKTLNTTRITSAVNDRVPLKFSSRKNLSQSLFSFTSHMSNNPLRRPMAADSLGPAQGRRAVLACFEKDMGQLKWSNHIIWPPRGDESRIATGQMK
jgi:hypothetical protein